MVHQPLISQDAARVDDPVAILVGPAGARDVGPVIQLLSEDRYPGHAFGHLVNAE